LRTKTTEFAFCFVGYEIYFSVDYLWIREIRRRDNEILIEEKLEEESPKE
jgi:hypothetical protein